MNVGISIEDAIQEGKITKEESAGSSGISGGNNRGKKPASQGKAPEVSAIFPPYPPNNRTYQPNPPTYPTYRAPPLQYLPPLASNYHQPTSSYQRLPPSNSAPEKKQFTPLGKPLSEVFSKLMRRGVLKPLDPRPLVLPLPPYVDTNLYCDFHQSVGHHTDQCRKLQYAIQDLIDQKIIPSPQAPNINHNPLPDCYHQTNHISTNIPIDPSHYIISSSSPKPHVVMREVSDIHMIRQCDQGNLRGNSDSEEKPKGAKGRDTHWWEDSEKEVETMFTFGLGNEPTKKEVREVHKRIKGKGKEVRNSSPRVPRYDGYFVKGGETTPNHGMPEPQFTSEKEHLSGFEIFANHTFPDFPAQTKTQSDWSDNLSRDLWKALFQAEPTEGQPREEASSTFPKAEGI